MVAARQCDTIEPSAAPPDPRAAARAARLRYVSDQAPGIRRRRAGRGFLYLGPDDQRITDAETLSRIKALAVPPAWTDVWICLHANGHIQATGRDGRGRKQYRYHARWQDVRDEAKYERCIVFGEALPHIREMTEAHLALSGLPRERVLATVVCLLEKSLIRIGNEEYARANGSVGLTTMRDGHVNIAGSLLRFAFRGKSGVAHSVHVRDRRLARLVKRCQDLPGEELFQYVDDQGERRTIGSGDVNAYLREIAGEEFTAKDFRTWAGTVLAAQSLAALDHADTESEAKRRVVCAVESVARRLGNTPSVCRKCYIHPAVLDAYLDGWLVMSMRQPIEVGRSGPSGLDPDELRVLRLLRENAT
jgi:DNA topoisomerase-1